MDAEGQSERDRIAVKIRGLMAKTVENGCTEAEAMAAFEKVGVLMREYDLTYKDVASLEDERYVSAEKKDFFRDRYGNFKKHEIVGLLYALSKLYTCRAYWVGADLHFYGVKNDADMAMDTAVMVRVAMESSYSAYSVTREAQLIHGRTRRVSFMGGMVLRLQERMLEIVEQRKYVTPTWTSKALVVIKQDQVDASFKENFQGIKNHKTKFSMRSQEAFDAGRQAAEKVELNLRIE